MGIWLASTAGEAVAAGNKAAISHSAADEYVVCYYYLLEDSAYDAQFATSMEQEVRTLSLDESYTVSSADITSFENSLAPLNTLSTMAGWFLLVILIIGGATNYITEVNSAMNLTVVFQMLGVGLLLTLVASLASVLFIMRYDP